MTSRQIFANRLNAQRSTGPKTFQGKSCVAQNARRHGLATSVMTDPAYSAAVEALAHQIAGTDSRPDILYWARRVAEAQIDLARIRQARHAELERALGSMDTATGPRAGTATVTSASIDTGSNAGSSASCPLNEAPPPDAGPLPSTELSSTLLAIDRYERRALSRRKFAIRELDAARRNDLCSPQPPVLAATTPPP